GEDRACLPLEGHASAGIVPNRGGAAARQHQDHLLEQVVLRFELLARRDLTDVAVIGGARGFVVDEHALAALARPGLELDGAQIGYVLRADDVEPFPAHEAQIRRILLGLELVRQGLRDGRVLRHATLSPLARLIYQPRAACGNATAALDRSAATAGGGACQGMP